MDADFRAERRRFILAAHPDRGGDAGAFVAGLQRFDDAAPTNLARTADAPPTADLAPTATPTATSTYADTDGPDARWPVSLLTTVLRAWTGLREPRH